MKTFTWPIEPLPVLGTELILNVSLHCFQPMASKNIIQREALTALQDAASERAIGTGPSRTIPQYKIDP